MIDNGKFNSMKQACDRYVDGHKIQARTQMASFLLARVTEFESGLNTISDNFINSVARRMKAAESIEPEAARQTRIQQLERDLEEFMMHQDNLAARFRALVSDSPS